VTVVDVPLMRSAEMYLIEAEAYARNEITRRQQMLYLFAKIEMFPMFSLLILDNL
jgi:ABC-type maltose transport system permease subunit